MAKPSFQRTASGASNIPTCAPGIDGMTVDELTEYLKYHWLEIRVQLECGRYRPQPDKRVEIPKPDGKTRSLGIPTLLDRFIQQAIAQVVSAQWEVERQAMALRAAQTKIQALVLELAHLKRMRFGVRSENRGHERPARSASGLARMTACGC